jgi:5-(carboxyamino)imidazole ribonucleotide mutase
MQVLILCGSASGLETLAATTQILKEFGVSYELHVASAHRTPERVRELVGLAEKAGCRAIIAAAGLAAHLAGAVASMTVLPVIGIPMAGGPLNGQDALLSTVQMPPGIPVATVAIGKPGATNAALLAVQMLALGDATLREKLVVWRRRQSEKVVASDPSERG